MEATLGFHISLKFSSIFRISIYFKSCDTNKIKNPIIIPISFGILLSFLLFLIVVNNFPIITKVRGIQRNNLRKNELNVISVTKTMDVGIITNNAAITYKM